MNGELSRHEFGHTRARTMSDEVMAPRVYVERTVVVDLVCSVTRADGKLLLSFCQSVADACDDLTVLSEECPVAVACQNDLEIEEILAGHETPD